MTRGNLHSPFLESEGFGWLCQSWLYLSEKPGNHNSCLHFTRTDCHKHTIEGLIFEEHLEMWLVQNTIPHDLVDKSHFSHITSNYNLPSMLRLWNLGSVVLSLLYGVAIFLKCQWYQVWWPLENLPIWNWLQSRQTQRLSNLKSHIYSRLFSQGNCVTVPDYFKRPLAFLYFMISFFNLATKPAHFPPYG